MVRISGLFFMHELQERKVNCPYCGEVIDVLIDCSVLHQSDIEDCQVCCRPINFDVTMIQDGKLTVVVSGENE